MKVSKTNRGFEIAEFLDAYGKESSVQQSSAIDLSSDDPDPHGPGSSFLWVGLTDSDPQILAKDAKAHGVETEETTGWVKYPIPDCVSIATRMHLNREQVEDLVELLQRWLDTGSLEEP